MKAPICRPCEGQQPSCFYCNAVLSPRHEHDHFPIPARHGGETTVPVCINCHDMKDRVPLKDWPVSLVLEGWEGMSPAGRMLAAKTYAVLLDQTRQRVAS